MDHKDRVQKEIDKTLEQFEHAERLKPNPYLATRIEARIKEEERGKSVGFLWAMFRSAFLLVIIIANIFTVFAFFDYNAHSSEKRENISIFAQEFGLEATVEDPFSSIE